MTNDSLPPPSPYYEWTCWLLMTISVGLMIGRIMHIEAPTGETPMLSANDRSRWCTVRALVEEGRYEIDDIIREVHPRTHRRYWSTIDRVRHRGPDGREHDYSSKPPLFPTLLAGQYWVLHPLTGATLADDPFFVMRWMLVLTNVLPMLLYFLVLKRLLGRLATSEASRLYVLGAATFGTFLTTFAVTLNNHLPAAICVLLSTALVLVIWRNPRCSGGVYAAAGLCSALAVANELPALAFLVAMAAAVAWKSPRRATLAFAPAALLVAAAFLGTNYLAHGTWTPAYAHRQDGPVLLTLPGELEAELDGTTDQPLPEAVRKPLEQAGIALSDQALLLVDRPHERWQIWDRAGHHRYAIVRSGATLEVRQWDNWYDYRGSYWRNKVGIDRGEPSRWQYAFHVLVGHHGVFSLTPIWLLSVVGGVLLWRTRRPGWAPLAALTLALTLVCLAFYVTRPEVDRNYGGVCSGFRWLFWLTPLWLLCAAPAVERVMTTWRGRVVLGLLLLASVASATYSAFNPWSHPWILNYGTYLGWWQY